MAPKPLLWHLLRGDSADMGGEFGSGAVLTLWDSTHDGETLDAHLEVKGSLRVLGNLNATNIVISQAYDLVAQGDTQIGDPTSPGNLTVHSLALFKSDVRIDPGKAILPQGLGVNLGSVVMPFDQLWLNTLRVASIVGLAGDPSIGYANTGLAPFFMGDGVGASTVAEALNSAQPYLRPYVLLKPTDAVPGMTNAYYIDKGATSHGYNVAGDAEGTPVIWISAGGQVLRWGPVGQFGTDLEIDFDIVRSMSTGPEGAASVASRNAIQFRGTLPEGVRLWYFYHRKGPAAS